MARVFTELRGAESTASLYGDCYLPEDTENSPGELVTVKAYETVPTILAPVLIREKIWCKTFTGALISQAVDVKLPIENQSRRFWHVLSRGYPYWVADPIAFHRPIWSRADVVLFLPLNQRNVAAVFSELFDDPPLDQMFWRVSLVFVGGSLVGLYCRLWEFRPCYVPYARSSGNVLRELVYFTSDGFTAIMFAVRLRAETTSEAFAKFCVEKWTPADTLLAEHGGLPEPLCRILRDNSVGNVSWYRSIHIHGTATTALVTLQVPLRILSRFTKDVCARFASAIGGSLCDTPQTRRVLRLGSWPDGEDKQRPAMFDRHTRWQYVHWSVRVLALLFFRTGLPGYCVLWILQQFHKFAIQREENLIGTISSVYASCRRAIGRRQ